MTVDEYYEHVANFADQLEEHEDGVFEYFVSGLIGTQPAEDCVSFRSAFVTTEETQELCFQLKMGLFGTLSDAQPERALAWAAFDLDVRYAERHRKTKRACEEYNRGQPLFNGAPRLFDAIRRRPGAKNPELEMIDESAVHCVIRGAYNVGPGHAKLVSHLPYNVTELGRKDFPDAPKFIRLYPYKFYEGLPPILVNKVAIVPANPKWLSTLSLFSGTKDYARYDLTGTDRSSNPADYDDYHAREIRRLEVAAQRTADDYLSMMIEELPRPDAKDGLMIGKCIHLDTRAPVGTAMSDAVLQHMDLAINVYTGVDRAKRMEQTLQNGKAHSANYRTHLYRIENIPFPSVFMFASQFFASQYLLSEWFDEIGVMPGG